MSGRSSQATSSSGARSGGPTCREAIGRPSCSRSRRSRSRSYPTRPSIPATWGSPRSRPSAPPTRSSPSSPAEMATRSAQRALAAPRGTFDVLPGGGRPRRALGRLAEEVLERAGYGYAETPVFESTELFARGVGEATDIVQKEMFTFDDQGGRSLTLRPEGTAPVCRAYVEHGMHKRPQPVKLWYWGPFFRYEAPQAGRYRQFTQVGVEAIGAASPSLDAEVIVLLADLLHGAGARDLR